VAPHKDRSGSIDAQGGSKKSLCWLYRVAVNICKVYVEFLSL